MSELWAERQRNTNRLARQLASYLFSQKKVRPIQLYGLSKLAWITSSYEDENSSYIRSTKIPAISSILDRDYSKMDLEQVAEDTAAVVGNKKLLALVRGHTGFTNFYNAYRNSVASWVEENFRTLLPMYKAALSSRSERDRIYLINKIESLPGIPKVNPSEGFLPPENFLTPTFFMLDPGIRFPLINGRKGVRSLLRALNVLDAGLESQYKALVKLYGAEGINDAADIDQIQADDNLFEFLPSGPASPKKALLKPKRNSQLRDLPLKDEADVVAIRQAVSSTQRRIHNGLTNKFVKALPDYTLLEGRSQDCMFDILVKNYDYDGSDLLVEAKSSVEKPHIRMAVGQLLDYWYELNGDKEPHHLAVLLPERPPKNVIALLEWADIGLMWFENGRLLVNNEWLEHLGARS